MTEVAGTVGAGLEPGSEERSPVRHVEPVMGTMVSFELRPGPLDPTRVTAALEASSRALHQVDEEFSTYRPESPMSHLRGGELALADAPDSIREVLRRCAWLKELSEGWFDPWAMPGGVDPTGFVKGWAVEEAGKVLTDAGIGDWMINAGGDIATCGRPGPGRRWLVGIVDPEDNRRMIATAALGGTLATSGRSERGDHILDPTTGRPSRRLLSASVAGPDLGVADALATALSAAGEEGLDWLVAVDDYSALIVRNDRSTLRTPGFPPRA